MMTASEIFYTFIKVSKEPSNAAYSYIKKKWNVQFTNPLPLPELLKRYTVKVSSTEYSTSDSENGHKMFKNCVEALYSINFPVALNKLDAEFEVSKHSYRA